MLWHCFGAIGTTALLTKWRCSLERQRKRSNACWLALARASERSGLMSDINYDREFARILAEQEDAAEERAPSSLKARLYTTLVLKQQATGPLASLDATLAAGHSVCVFEKLVQIMPFGEKSK